MEKICENKTTLCFVGGYYSSSKTIFEELEQHGIFVPNSERFYREFIVFDMEAMLVPVNNKITEKLCWTHHHLPSSVAICSNVDGYTSPHCIVNVDSDELIKEMVVYMNKIAVKVRHDKINKFEQVFRKLSELILEWENEKEMNSSKKANNLMLSQLKLLEKKFEQYCFEVPVLGFNSARYDLNLIKGRILKALQIHKTEQSFVIKKNNSYICISNGEFKFLDITQFLSPGTSYVNFLSSFDVEDKKGFFPYEFFDSEEKLQERSLPPVESFWSSLKNKNVLDDGVHTIEENYEWLKMIWKKEKMTTFKDFLVWYNKLDVYPFVVAVKRLCCFLF